MRTTAISALAIFALLAGCAGPNTAGERYSRRDTLRTMQVRQGEILMIVPVVIDGHSTRLGLVGGAAIGHAVGDKLGEGSSSHVAGAIGAVGGAIAGQAIEKKITEQDGLEITIELDSGKIIAIVQEATVEFSEGERVRVLASRGDRARVLKLR